MTPACRICRALLAVAPALLALGLLHLRSLPGGRSPGSNNASGTAHRILELDEAVRQAHRQSHERHRLVVTVSRGQMSLLEASARWMNMHRRGPFFWEVFRQAHAGASDEERHCRGMIEMVTDLLNDDDPCQAQAVRARLERELDQCLCHGPLSFRDPRVGCGL